MSCPGGGATTLTGKVYDPAGDLPLYNAIVYVPNGPVEPFAPGLTCDQCGAPASGSPLVTALSRSDGSFTLTNVPAGDDIPLVIQIGHWRRQVTVPHVAACATTALIDPNLTRLPRNQHEGDIPRMAIAAGQADPFECLLRKIGIADSEFTPPNGGGRVHYYVQNGINLDPPGPSGKLLYGSLSTLENYDIVILPCEGAPSTWNKSDTAMQNLIDYTSAGGRLFTTHYSYVWLSEAPQPFPSTADWSNTDQDYDDSTTITGTVDTSFPKGRAFAEWLVAVGASKIEGQLPIREWRHDLDTAYDPPSRVWIRAPIDGVSSVQHFTFNTPILPPGTDAGAALQCGRVVFSDFHVSAKAQNKGVDSFPAECKNEGLSGQEKALAFMLFDLSSCIQTDTTPPIPPIL